MNRSSALLLVVVLLAVGCSKPPAETAVVVQPEPSLRSIAVTTTVVGSTDVPVTLGAVGEVQSVAAPTISAEVAGRVIELRVDVGDRVKKGEVLARLDRSSKTLERDAAQGEASRLQALVINQESVVRRYHELAQSSAVAQSTIDEAEAQLAALRAEAAAMAARASLAAEQLAHTVVVAPVAGLIDKRLVAVGDFVKDGTPLFRLVDGTALRLMMIFPEPAIGQLRVGTPLTVMTAVNLELRFDAVITELRPMVDSASKGVVAYADIKDSNVTRAGSSADVRAIVALHKDAVVVPQLSLVRRPAGEVIYVIGADKKATQRRVVSGIRLDDTIEIIDGLSAGEVIAVDGAGFLTDGVTVEVKGR